VWRVVSGSALVVRRELMYEIYPMSTSNRHVAIINAFGLNLRAASKFVERASRFRAEVWVTHDSRRVNGKSILEPVTLAATFGSRLHIQVDGPEADAALDALTLLVDRGFEESEPVQNSISQRIPFPSQTAILPRKS
jgi:phosphocarrier protein HPr